jgi:hypothetical protein
MRMRGERDLRRKARREVSEPSAGWVRRMSTSCPLGLPLKHYLRNCHEKKTTTTTIRQTSNTPHPPAKWK